MATAGERKAILEAEAEEAYEREVQEAIREEWRTKGPDSSFFQRVADRAGMSMSRAIELGLYGRIG